MTHRPAPIRHHHLFAVATLVLIALFAPVDHAYAACFSNPLERPAAPPKLQYQPRGSASAALSATQGRDQTGDPSIVGMWAVEFLVGNGPAVWDQGFELFHSDGTEIAVDNGVPPSLGNVCVGVWKQVAPRTIKLRHMTWNWDLDGHVTGTFLLLVNLTVDRGGNRYEGTYVSDSFDLDGNVIPDFHAEGIVRGTRITVD